MISTEAAVIARVKASEDPKKLAENLGRRFDSSELEGPEIEVELEDPEKLAEVPGVAEFRYGDERKDGLGGKPTSKLAAAKLESRRDAVNCFLAILKGFSLVVIDSDREWDLRQLRRYDPDLKRVSGENVEEFLEVENSVNVEGFEQLEYENLDAGEMEELYNRYLT